MQLLLIVFLIGMLGLPTALAQDKDVLFLVDDAGDLSTSDAHIELMMSNSGYTVFTTTADNSVVGDTLDMELVVIPYRKGITLVIPVIKANLPMQIIMSNLSRQELTTTTHAPIHLDQETAILTT
ncbi:MAG: hypothetical protein ACOC31_01520 [Bacteroidota bacterium]